MALPTQGEISTTMIMNELGVAVQSRTFASLWALAKDGSIPKNKANAGGPYVLPTDWYGYVQTNPNAWWAFPFIIGSSTATKPATCNISNNWFNLLVSLPSGTPAGRQLTVGDVLHNDDAGNTIFNGGGNYWKGIYYQGNSNIAVKISTAGVVEEITLCSSLPSSPTLSPSSVYLAQSSGASSNNANATVGSAPIGTIVKFKIHSTVGAVAGCTITASIRINGSLVYTGPTYNTQYVFNDDVFSWTSNTNGGITVNFSVAFGGGGNSANATFTLTT